MAFQDEWGRGTARKRYGSAGMKKYASGGAGKDTRAADFVAALRRST